MASRPLIDRYHDDLGKLAYFLQGVSASAIAFALHETADRPPSWSLFVIGLAVAVWAFSFAGGILYWHAIQVATKANLGLNQIENGKGDAKLKGIFEERFDKYNRRAANWYRVLSWGLLAGALVYTAGHALHLLDTAKSIPGSSQPVIGRFQEVSNSGNAPVYVLDTKTGELRFCTTGPTGGPGTIGVACMSPGPVLTHK